MDELEVFGRMMIEKVRDVTIQDWDSLVEGKSKGITAKAVNEKLASFTQEELEIIKWIIPKIVDTTMHNFLCTIETSKKFDIKVNTENGVIERLQDESDGLYELISMQDNTVTVRLLETIKNKIAIQNNAKSRFWAAISFIM